MPRMDAQRLLALVRGEAEVTILEVGHPQQIAGALRRDRYHVLHLSAHGSPDGPELGVVGPLGLEPRTNRL